MKNKKVITDLDMKENEVMKKTYVCFVTFLS